MYLSRLFISNYRSIDRLDLRFHEGKNVIVGKNNAGKSNIVRAIDLVLGENAPTYQKSENITANDFHNGVTENEVVILVQLTRNPGEQLDYESISKCYGYYILGTGGWGGRAIMPDRAALNDDPDDLLADIQTLFEIDFDDNEVHKAYINPKKGEDVFREQLENKHEFVYIFHARYNKELDRVEKDMRFLYREDGNHEWVIAQKPSIRNELIQSAIIPAFRDPNNQLRTASYTWYGKLLQNYVDAKHPDLLKAFQKVKDASNAVFKGLENAVNDSRVKVAFPDTTISFQFNPETKQDIYKSALIYVNDGFSSQLQDKGSGIQSAVIIGLFDFYVRNIAHPAGSLLAIEEPELYLHPHGRRVISHRLEDFLEGNRNQVIITTHSTEFVTATNKDLHIILVKKKDGKTDARSTIFKNPKDKRLLLKGANAEMFFADHVVLVEGGEKYVLEAAADAFASTQKIEEGWLDNKNVSIIAVTGKHEMLKYTLKLDELNIPWTVLTDFDFIRNGLSEFLTGQNFKQNDVNHVNTLKSEIAADTGTKKDYKKLSDIPGSFHERIATLRDALRKKGIYVFSGELEDLYATKAEQICPASLGKEERAICVASEVDTKNIEVLLHTDEIFDAFAYILKRL